MIGRDEAQATANIPNPFKSIKNEAEWTFGLVGGKKKRSEFLPYEELKRLLIR